MEIHREIWTNPFSISPVLKINRIRGINRKDAFSKFFSRRKKKRTVEEPYEKQKKKKFENFSTLSCKDSRIGESEMPKI